MEERKRKHLERFDARKETVEGSQEASTFTLHTVAEVLVTISGERWSTCKSGFYLSPAVIVLQSLLFLAHLNNRSQEIQQNP